MRQSLRFTIASFIFLFGCFSSQASELPDNEANRLNGFDLLDLSVPQEDIFQGGPPREGIPAIDAPKFLKPEQVDFLSADDKVLGVVVDGISRAYPIRILTWHEIVNDKIGDTAFTVTYCPLCGSGLVFAADVAGLELSFGVSGLIFDNNMLLFDRNTESLWSQIMGEAISGKLKGQKLTLLPVVHTTWADWQQRFPETQVLSTDTGHVRDYTDNPYTLYEQVGLIYFPRRNIAPNTYLAHEMVLGLTVNGVTKAYPYIELSQQGRERFTDQIGDTDVVIHWNNQARSAHATDADGKMLAGAYSYWFSWFSFNPEADVFVSEQ